MNTLISNTSTGVPGTTTCYCSTDFPSTVLNCYGGQWTVDSSSSTRYRVLAAGTSTCTGVSLQECEHWREQRQRHAIHLSIE